MRMRAVEQAKHAAASHCTRVPSGLLQRKCACGATPGADGRCAHCRNERVPRSATQPEGPAQIPSVVHEVLRAPGSRSTPRRAGPWRRVLAASRSTERTFTRRAPRRHSPSAPPRIRSNGEPTTSRHRRCGRNPRTAMRLRWDFSRVRVHADTRAAQSAQALNALAYTVGDHIVFGSGRFAPRGHEGQHLLGAILGHERLQSREPPE
jgi:hypothetical protein